MTTEYSTRSLSNYYICNNKECEYHSKLGVYEQNIIFIETKWVLVDSLLEFIKSYEGSLGDLPKELSELKKQLEEE